MELLAAVFRRARTGNIVGTQAVLIDRVFRHEQPSHFQLISPNSDVIDRAMDLVSIHPLRAYDAIQLSAVWHLQSELLALGMPEPIFICADDQLNLIAAAEGLTVDNPNDHP